MTPSEEIKNMLIPILSSMRAHGSTEAEIIAYRNGFTTGAMWRQTYPHWVSIEDELPKRFFADPNESVIVITYGLHTKEAYYRYDKDEWVGNTEVTHWMPLPQEPVLSNSENTGKNHLIDANNMIDHFADASKKVEKGGEE